MGWVVKSWRVEALTELVGTATARELADAVAYLAALEAFGVQTRDQVAEQRHRLRPPRVTVPESITQVVRRSARPRRATMYESPLPELFAGAGPSRAF